MDLALLLDWLGDALSNPTNVSWLQALLASAIGAWVGSWATQRTINKHEVLKQARAELNAINHAANLCFVIMNYHLGFKKQMTLPMQQRYEKADKAVREKLEVGDGPALLEADFLILPTADMPTSYLQQILLEQVSMGGRGLAAAMQLRGVSQGLHDSLVERRSLIEAARSSSLSFKQLAEFYLALQDDQGNIDSRFRDNLQAIVTQTDDCIFFSSLVAKDLNEHGKRLLSKHGRRLGVKRESLKVWKWNEGSEDLMPKEAEYQDWLKGFTAP